MATCEYCGSLIQEGASYCSNCGAPAPAIDSSSSVSTADPVIQQGAGDYSLILVSLGTCAKAAASDLLEDLLGYTSEQSADLFDMIPAQIAQQLTYEQALYLAKALTEYGMEVSVRNSSGYLSTEEEDTGSIFDSAGSLLEKAASVLGMITGLNRMRKFRKLEERRLYQKPFRKAPYPEQPPIHVRRSIKTVSDVPKAHHHLEQPGMHHEDRYETPRAGKYPHSPSKPQGEPGRHHRNDGSGRGPMRMPR